MSISQRSLFLTKVIGPALLGFTLLSPLSAVAQTVDWSQDFRLTNGPRPNPYGLPEEEFKAAQTAGRIHTQIYPVTVTGILPPYEPVKRFIETRAPDPFRRALQYFFRRFADVRSVNDLFGWIGLHEYPKAEDEGVYSVPYPNGTRPETLMGLSLIERNGAKGFTISCAACHSSQLFGKTVLGLTNRFPRANESFRRSLLLAPYYNAHAFATLTGANAAELALMQQSLENLKAVGTRRPMVLGLDTSLAQVALSLNHRNADGDATKNPEFEKHPRPDLLDDQPADSKPAVWWNLKYKTRFLSDGSVISGNPILTNILWNEIGRGTDLHDLFDWLSKNGNVIKELTTAVFSSEAPRITDFFPAEHFDLEDLKKGQKLFNGTCAKCHGVYDKAWDQIPASSPLADQLKTTQVHYFAKTPVINVGTDPLRRLGMKSLEKLNDLTFSKENGIVIQVQNGYVPPPLLGIWARWPYFHNNMAPSLCAVLTRATDRPETYYAGEAKDPQKDFDMDCNGYPQGASTPLKWQTKEFYYDSNRQGLSRQGHDEGVFLKDGQELFSKEEKKSLIHYLQTL